MYADTLVWAPEWSGRRALLFHAGLTSDEYDPNRKVRRLSVRRNLSEGTGLASLEPDAVHFMVPGQPEPIQGCRYGLYRLYNDGSILDAPDNVVITVTGPVVVNAANVIFTELVTAYLATRYDLTDAAIESALAAFPQV